MSSRVRLLPALIGAAGVLMVLRLGAMASAAEEAKHPEGEAGPAQEAAAPSADAAATPGHDAATPSGATAGEVKTAEASTAPVHDGTVAPPAPSVGFAQTKGEAQVLEDLAERRAALDARERDLAMREQLISVTEKRVSERVTELKDLETRLNALLAQRDEQEEAQLGSLVKTYEAMKPADAAKIFNKLDRTVLLNVASRMKPAKIGAVMAAMDPARAQDLTVMLAKRVSVSKPVAAATPTPASAPLASAAPAETPDSAAAEQPHAAAPAAPVGPAPAEAPHG